MCCNARNLIAAWDHAQEIASSKPCNQDHSGRSTVKSSRIGDWMSAIAEEHTMNKTSRFGPVNVSLLHAVFPAYSTLEARANAPDTHLEAYSLNEVNWVKLGPAAGCVGHWKPFAILAAIVVRELEAGNSVTVCCVYAAFREIVASFLQFVCDWKFGRNSSSAASNGPATVEVSTNKKPHPEVRVTCLTAKQIKGNTADVVISFFTKRNADEFDYQAQSKDVGKWTICLTRAKKKNIVIFESWPSRWNHKDHIQRLMLFFYNHQWKKEDSRVHVSAFQERWTQDGEIHESIKDGTPACNCDSFAKYWMENYATLGTWKDDENGNYMEPGTLFSSKHQMEQLNQESMQTDNKWYPTWTPVDRVPSNLWRKPVEECLYLVHLTGSCDGWSRAVDTARDESDESEDSDDDSEPPVVAQTGRLSAPVL